MAEVRIAFSDDVRATQKTLPLRPRGTGFEPSVLRVGVEEIEVRSRYAPDVRIPVGHDARTPCSREKTVSKFNKRKIRSS